MTKSPVFAAAALVAALAAAPSFARTLDAEGSWNAAADAVSVKSRAEVRAELEQARRDGTIDYLDAEGSLRVQPTGGVAKTRAQVKAELAQALSRGDIVANDDSGRTLRQVFPTHYTSVQ